MPLYRTKWKFLGTQGSRWAESWDILASSAVSATQISEATIKTRLILLNRFAKLLHISATLPTSITPDRTRRPLGRTGQAEKVDDISGQEEPGTSITVQLWGKEGHWRLWHLRGVPDSMVTGPTVGEIKKAYRDDITDFVRAIVSEQARIRRRIREADDGLVAIPRQFPKTVLPRAGFEDLTELTFEPGTPLPPAGSLVTLANFPPKRFPGLTGQFRVYSRVGAVLTVEYRAPRVDPGSPSPGYMRPFVEAAPEEIDLARTTILQVYHRDTFSADGGRGRRSSRRLRKGG